MSYHKTVNECLERIREINDSGDSSPKAWLWWVKYLLVCMEQEDPPATVKPSFALRARHQAVELRAELLVIAGTLFVQKHQIDLELAPAPVGVRLEKLPGQGKLLLGPNFDQEDGVIPGNCKRP